MRTFLLLLVILSISVAQAVVQPRDVVLAADTGERGTCDVRPRNVQDCQRRAEAFCGTGGTSAFFVCRDVFNKWCTQPKRTTSVAQCLAERCDSLGAAGGHSYDFTVQACRRGRFNRPDMENLCKEQTCTCSCPAPPPCPEGQKRLELPDALVGCNCPSPQCIPDPDYRGPCDVRPRTAESCAERAVKFCGEGGTSSFVVCRQVYQQWCKAPQRVASVAECLAKRCDTLPAAPGHTQADTIAACRRGRFNGDDMERLCKEQTCNCKCTVSQCPLGTQRLTTPTNLQGCACPFCEACPAPAPLKQACATGLTLVQVPGPVGTDQCMVNKCQDCAGSPAPICPAPSISRVTSKDPVTGCPVQTCVACTEKCPTLRCPSGQRAVTKPGDCCASECQQCPNTLESCPKLSCGAKQFLVFPQSHCCPICSDTPVENDRLSTSSTANPYIGAAIVGGCLATGGIVATILILKGLY